MSNALLSQIAQGAPAPAFDYLQSKQKAGNVLSQQYENSLLPQRTELARNTMGMATIKTQMDLFLAKYDMLKKFVARTPTKEDIPRTLQEIEQFNSMFQPGSPFRIDTSQFDPNSIQSDEQWQQFRNNIMYADPKDLLSQLTAEAKYQKAMQPKAPAAWKPTTREEALQWEQDKAGLRGKDFEIQFDPETGRPVSISRGGPGGASSLTKPTTNKVQEKLMSGREQLARMQAIYSEFKPEYQELGTRWDTFKTSVKAKLGYTIPKEEKEQLLSFKKFQRKAIENINLYIKEITGAQMSEKEADRLRLAQPDPGENWWTGDDPITFKAKMDDVLKMTRAAIARYEFYLSKGLTDMQVKEIIKSDTAVSLETIASRM